MVRVTIECAKEVVVIVVVKRRREATLAGQFLLLQLVVVALLLLTVGVIAVRQSTETFTIERGAQLRSVSEYVANLGLVRDQLSRAASSPVAADAAPRDLAPSVDRALSLSGASDVLIASPDGTVIAASEPSLNGSRAALGESVVRDGRGWSGDVEIDGRRTLVGHAPILDDRGRLIGLAIAQQGYPTIRDRLTGAVPDLLFFLGLGAVLGGLGAYAVSRVLKRRTQGLAPTEIANLADHRAALLHSIREGVVAVGTDARVTMMNDAARQTLDLADDPVGRKVHDLGLDPVVAELLGGSDAEILDAVALVGTRVVVFNRRSARSKGRGIGSVTTMRDRTEMVSLQSQLSSNLSITDALRAQTHEFTNQLHTISGLVQLGEYDEVTTLVGTLTHRRTQVGRFVDQRIDAPAVAALLLAKDSAAAERGVTLELDPSSSLPALTPEDSADLATIVGNLIDNAVDAVAGGTDPKVVVLFGGDDEAIEVRIRDNGPGVPEELRSAIFVRGFSTKPDVLGGRGIGLPLVRLICNQRGGRVLMEDSDAGAVFRITFPVRKGEGS